jgi:hypothetical protein
MHKDQMKRPWTRPPLALLFVISLGLPAPAFAVPILYGIKFEVTSGTAFLYDCDYPDCDGSQLTQWDAVGNVYYGFFSIDSSILANDGYNLSGDLGFLVIKIEDDIWGYNSPLDNAIEDGGFRGPIPGDPDCPGDDSGDDYWSFCLYAPSPGFDVVDGRITGLRGGVFGGGDAPFVDFLGTYFNTVGRNNIDRMTWLEGQGTMTIFRIPEPSSAALLLIGFVLIGLLRRRPTRR